MLYPLEWLKETNAIKKKKKLYIVVLFVGLGRDQKMMNEISSTWTISHEFIKFK